MKMTTNDQIRQELIEHFITQLADGSASLVMTLHNNGETSIPDEETTKPGSIVKTKTIDKASVFYAVTTNQAKAAPTSKHTAIINNDYHYISSSFEEGVWYNKLYITTSVENLGGMGIEFDQVVLEAQDINIAGVVEDIVLTIGNNSRGNIDPGYTREFNFLITFDGSGN